MYVLQEFRQRSFQSDGDAAFQLQQEGKVGVTRQVKQPQWFFEDQVRWKQKGDHATERPI